MNIKKEVRLELIKHIDQEYKIGATRFFKHEIDLIGVRAPIVRKISRDIFDKISHLSKNEIFVLLEELMDGKLEEIALSFYCSYMLKNKFEEKDYYIFHKWIEKYIQNWAHCDEICTKSLGHLFIKFPNLIKKTKNMVKGNTWLRRAAYVSLIPSIKKGNNHDFALDLLNNAFDEKEDIVQKGAE
jgi:3-methyladenine DNA glycosylase AlkD